MSRRKKLPPDPVEARIESLSHEGRGIARVEGKTVFVDGGLPGERVMFRYTGSRPRFDEGAVVEVIDASTRRVEPPCPHFSLCGGCAIQHMDPAGQISHKQDVLLEQLQHIGRVTPDEVLPPLAAADRGYRRKARLGVKLVYKKDRVLVGFREKRKPYIADIDSCLVLHPSIGLKLGALKELVTGLSIPDRIPQIEAATGDTGTALVIRHLEALTPADRELLAAFERAHAMRIYLQAGDTSTVTPLSPQAGDALRYHLPAHDVVLDFGPLDFTQVNFEMNRLLVDRVVSTLDPSPDEDVLDLFCGIGNFSLPLARRARRVTGVEGSPPLVDKAVKNALNNGIGNAAFEVSDLYAAEISGGFLKGRHDKILLDPPRSGAREVIEQMNLKAAGRLVYVSCNPATLARDAGILVNGKGFRLRQAGVLDMFPHTTHVESIAVFERR